MCAHHYPERVSFLNYIMQHDRKRKCGNHLQFYNARLFLKINVLCIDTRVQLTLVNLHLLVNTASSKLFTYIHDPFI